MSNEWAVAGLFARLFAFWHMAVACYLIFFAGNDDRLLVATALTKGVLGACVYIVVLRPAWAFYGTIEKWLLPFTLGVMFLFSILVTAVLIRAFALEPPHRRLLAMTRDSLAQLRR